MSLTAGASVNDGRRLSGVLGGWPFSEPADALSAAKNLRRYGGRARPRVADCAYCERRCSSKIRDSHMSEIREALDATTGQRRRRRSARRQ